VNPLAFFLNALIIWSHLLWVQCLMQEPSKGYATGGRRLSPLRCPP
jgi:hypothetical protein